LEDKEVVTRLWNFWFIFLFLVVLPNEKRKKVFTASYKKYKKTRGKSSLSFDPPKREDSKVRVGC